MRLFSKIGSNPKIAKSDASGEGYLTLILHLSPANKSGYETCAFASPGCRASCLNSAGLGKTNIVQNARIAKTKLWFENRDAFKVQLVKEITGFLKKCLKLGVKPAIRLNGTSDIAFERVWPELFAQFPTVTFYDYTKDPSRVGWVLPNYHITFSRSETNDSDCLKVLQNGGNVSVVFHGEDYPPSWNNYPTHNAYDHDLRFLDPPGVGALCAKGRAKRDVSGFVVK